MLIDAHGRTYAHDGPDIVRNISRSRPPEGTKPPQRMDSTLSLAATPETA